MTKSGAPTVSAGELPSGRLDEEGWPVLKPTLLTVHRTSPEDVKTRQVIFSLDGKKIGQLLYGQSLTREIPPGRHSLRANNTLVWRTVEFDAEPGAESHYRCVNRAPESLYFMLFIFGVAPLYVTLERGAPPEG
jgi:hypothetical protein